MLTRTAHQQPVTAVAPLPSYLALTPADVLQNDGTFRSMGLRTRSVMHHPSALEMAVRLNLEWNTQLLDVVRFDDVLAIGGPAWAERVVERLNGECAPDLLVQVEVGGRV